MGEVLISGLEIACFCGLLVGIKTGIISGGGLSILYFLCLCLLHLLV